MNDLQNTFFFQFSSSSQNCSFEKILKKTADVIFKKHTPLKKRYDRTNQAPSVIKTMTTEIVKVVTTQKQILLTERQSKHSWTISIQLM